MQQAKKRAAAPSTPMGMPTPRPIFWLLVRPSLVAGGESGMGVDGSEEVAEEVVDEVDDEEGDEDDESSLPDVEDGRREDISVVGLGDGVEPG